MKVSKPKLLPTLVCLAVVGLAAATVPYPGLLSGFEVINSEAN